MNSVFDFYTDAGIWWESGMCVLENFNIWKWFKYVYNKIYWYDYMRFNCVLFLSIMLGTIFTKPIMNYINYWFLRYVWKISRTMIWVIIDSIVSILVFFTFIYIFKYWWVYPNTIDEWDEAGKTFVPDKHSYNNFVTVAY